APVAPVCGRHLRPAPAAAG
ncbi:hypothetical protein, partial [Escherichia coli]